MSRLASSFCRLIFSSRSPTLVIKVDFADAEIIARAVFQRQDFIAVDFQVFGRAQQVDGGKTVRFDAQLVGDRRVVKTVAVFH